jgi:hypothetical protein
MGRLVGDIGRSGGRTSSNKENAWRRRPSPVVDPDSGLGPPYLTSAGDRMLLWGFLYCTSFSYRLIELGPGFSGYKYMRGRTPLPASFL